MITVYMDKAEVNSSLLHEELVAALGGETGGGPLVVGVGPVTQGIAEVYVEDWATDKQRALVERVIAEQDPKKLSAEQAEEEAFRTAVVAFVAEAGGAIKTLEAPDEVDTAALAVLLRQVLVVVQKIAAEYLD